MIPERDGDSNEVVVAKMFLNITEALLLDKYDLGTTLNEYVRKGVESAGEVLHARNDDTPEESGESYEEYIAAEPEVRSPR